MLSSVAELNAGWKINCVCVREWGLGTREHEEVEMALIVSRRQTLILALQHLGFDPRVPRGIDYWISI